MREIDIHKPYERLEPFPDGSIVAIDFQGAPESFRYEELCSRYNQLLEEVRYLTSLNNAVMLERDAIRARADTLEDRLRMIVDE